MSAADTPRPTAAVVGCAGTVLTADEQQFMAQARPFGFILFARNVDNPGQVAALTAAFRSAVGNDNAPVLIDQEGGRVARLGPPHWPKYPPAGVFGVLAEIDPDQAVEATTLGARLIAEDLRGLGITVDCLPVLDVPEPGSHGVIGDRAYAETPDIVALLGRAACDGLMQGGILPVIKHIPGHGRAKADSHLELPEVEAPIDALRQIDFSPFKSLADAPCAMTAHVRYLAIDPTAPVTVSKMAIDKIVRGEIGFDGLLFSDDLSMEALSGSLAERTAAAMGAGCDIALHCNGNLEEARAVTGAAGPLSDAALGRWRRALDRLPPLIEIDVNAARRRFEGLLATIAP